MTVLVQTSKREAVAHRLGDSERNRNPVDRYQRPQPQRNGNGQSFDDESEHGAVLKIAFPEIELQVVPHHVQESFVRRFVEAELALEVGDQRRIQPVGGSGLSGIHRYLARPRVAASAADGCGRRHGSRRCGGDDLVDGPAGRELHDDEVDQDNAEERRRDEQ